MYITFLIQIPGTYYNSTAKKKAVFFYVNNFQNISHAQPFTILLRPKLFTYEDKHTIFTFELYLICKSLIKANSAYLCFNYKLSLTFGINTLRQGTPNNFPIPLP